jgi:hypothetical protein
MIALEIYSEQPSSIILVPQASLAALARHKHRPRHETLFLFAETQSPS